VGELAPNSPRHFFRRSERGTARQTPPRPLPSRRRRYETDTPVSPFRTASILLAGRGRVWLTLLPPLCWSKKCRGKRSGAPTTLAPGDGPPARRPGLQGCRAVPWYPRRPCRAVPWYPRRPCRAVPWYPRRPCRAVSRATAHFPFGSHSSPVAAATPTRALGARLNVTLTCPTGGICTRLPSSRSLIV
jgi:hypothetical protein